MRPVRVLRLGREAYATTLSRQRTLAERRARGTIDDTLIIVEHDPVFTLGRRRTSAGNVLLAGDTPVVQVERGGDVTWHGPGQLVAYPIFALRPDERDLHQVLRKLEEALIRLLGELGLSGQRRPKFTGVWCEGKKIASIGIAVSGAWVTSHGVALNVSCDLSWFSRINPCGLDAKLMTSIADLGGPVPDWRDLEDALVTSLAVAFDRDPI